MEALAATPPPTTRVHTPPAPRFGGYHDNWNPYSEPETPRRSARLSQHSVNRTPSPRFAARHCPEPLPVSFGSPRSKKPRTTATMTSPGASPQKKRLPKVDSVRRASGHLTAEGTAQAAAALGISPAPAEKHTQANRAGASSVAGMLPTPAKTPQKPPTAQEKAKLSTIARNIFSTDDEPMPQSKKSSASQHVLDSFAAVPADESFEIFTDTNNRVPKIDNSMENPFFGPGAAAAPNVRRTGRGSRRTVNVPGVGRMEIKDAVSRDDGTVITFRGKKLFVPHAVKDEVDDEDEPGSRSPSRRLTRSVKPVVLFPRNEHETEPEQERAEDDEEAVTDVEDHVPSTRAKDDAQPTTPFDAVEATPDTPATPRLAPASPPTTARVTRYGNNGGADVTPMKPKAAREGSSSPFKNWQVSKGGSAKHGVKRQGKPLQDGPAKRAKA